jgi:hypothetical protein
MELVSLRNGGALPNAGVAAVQEEKKPKPIMDAQKDSLLYCQICMGKHDSHDKVPVSLNCGHTICIQCAKSIFKNRAIKCPFCNQAFMCNEVSSLGRNYTVLELLELEKVQERSKISD